MDGGEGQSPRHRGTGKRNFAGIAAERIEIAEISTVENAAQQGGRVRIGAGGVSVFTIVSVDEDARTTINRIPVDASASAGTRLIVANLANLVPTF